VALGEEMLHMNVELDEGQQYFLETTKRFLETETPISEVRRLANEPDGFDRSWWAKGAALGWVSLLVSDVNGGGNLSGNGLSDLAIVAEEYGRCVAPGPLFGCNVVASALNTAANEGDAGHTDELTQIIAGDMIATWAYQDANSSWRPNMPTLSAELNQGDYVLNGQKTRVEFGAQADLFLVTAALDGRATQFLVPRSTQGLQVEPLDTLDLVRRYANVAFNDVRLAASALVGEVANAETSIAEQFLELLVLQCAEMSGAANKVFTMTTEYAADRYTFGRPLNSYQALKHRFADMKVAVEASHATTDEAAASVGSRSPDAEHLASVAKAYVGRNAPEIAQDCVQLHGGIGVTWDHDLHLYLRRITTDRVLAGTPQDHQRHLGELIVQRGH
jgi:alkylation response protein AidB-like acyl-CoA dehydrogenase